jgi:bacterioferritin
MKGDSAVLGVLNELLHGELTAVHQYMLHARMCEDWGYDRLFAKIHEESREELEHADHVIERILYLDGAPDVQKLGSVTPGKNVPEQLRADYELEKSVVAALNRGIKVARSAADNGTAELLEHMLEDTEEHANWLETQLTAIDQIGVERYLAEQLKKQSA